MSFYAKAILKQGSELSIPLWLGSNMFKSFSHQLRLGEKKSTKADKFEPYSYWIGNHDYFGPPWEATSSELKVQNTRMSSISSP